MQNYNAELVLGAHHEESTEARDKVIKVAGEILKNPQNKVVVFLEAAGNSKEIADIVLLATQRGFPPTIALSSGMAGARTGNVSVPESKIRPEQWKKEVIGPVRDALFPNLKERSFHKSLDELYLGTFTPDGKPRLSVLWESTNPYNALPEDYAEKYSRLMKFMRNGSSEEALGIFKDICTTVAQALEERDDNAVKRLQSLPDLENTTIVGMFGTGHSNIGHKLRALGVPVKMHFADVTSGNKSLGFCAEDILIRKLRLNGPDQISDLEWNQGLIGMFEMHLDRNRYSEYIPLQKEKELNNRSVEIAQSIKSMEDAQRYFRKLRPMR